MKTVEQWPSWRYGPDGQAAIFQSEDEIPEGWEDHPSKVGLLKEPKRTGRPKKETLDL